MLLSFQVTHKDAEIVRLPSQDQYHVSKKIIIQRRVLEFFKTFYLFINKLDTHM